MEITDHEQKLREQLAAAEKKRADDDRRIQRIKKQISQLDAKKNQVLADVVQRAVRMPYFRNQLGKMLYNHASEEEQKVLTEFLRIKVVEPEPEVRTTKLAPPGH